MEITGWGRFPIVTADVHEPVDFSSLQMLLTSNNPATKLVARGAGRSYGDSALAQRVISSRFMDNFSALDESNLTIRCGAGVTLDAILRVCVPRGWFLPVVPGTSHVSVGGAIAADVHGKNHHVDGTFCDHLTAITLLLANGDLLSCSPSKNQEIFHATCGGMGLTGIIIDATIQLRAVPGAFIQSHSLVANNLQECFELLENNQGKHYSVAWLDCLARGPALGRSILFLGDHIADRHKRPAAYQTRLGITVPFNTPGFLLNRQSMTLFNNTYFKLKRRASKPAAVKYNSFFFPLDNIANWNRLYGAKGFLQYQFLVPEDSAYEAIAAVLHKVAKSGKGSFLSVLKKMGPANKNYLSFPASGFTLALDFKFERSLFPLLEQLDEIVLAYSGRLYLAKDARMNEKVFKAGYPQWEKFAEIKRKVDPKGLFASLQSDRIGLTDALYQAGSPEQVKITR